MLGFCGGIGVSTSRRAPAPGVDAADAVPRFQVATRRMATKRMKRNKKSKNSVAPVEKKMDATSELPNFVAPVEKKMNATSELPNFVTPVEKTLDAASDLQIEDIYIPSEVEMQPDLPARMQTLAEDVSGRPLYYANAGVVLFTFYLAANILHSVLAVINEVPLAQDFFEVIGLVYVVWFLWEYVRDNEKRGEMNQRVESFVRSFK